MSAPAWLMEAIKAAVTPEKADLPVAVTACNRNQNGLRLHETKPGTLVNKGFAGFVTAVTVVTAEKEAPSEFSEIAPDDLPEIDEEAKHANWIYHFIDSEPETAVVNQRAKLTRKPG